MARGAANLLVLITGKNLASTAFSQAQSDLKKLGKEGQATHEKLGLASAALKGAALGAAASVGYMALRWAKEGIQSAIDEEAAVARLSKALENVGQASRLTGVEDFIAQTSRAAAVADDELRPALGRLITATGDSTEAQRLLGLALDISAGSSKSLDSVTTALSRAAMGNFTSLNRLGVPLSDNTKKTKDLNAAVRELSDRFSGNAATAAATTAGQMKALSIAVDEAKEAFGTGFLAGIDAADGKIGSFTDTLYDAQPVLESFGKTLGSLLNTGSGPGVSASSAGITKLIDFVTNLKLPGGIDPVQLASNTFFSAFGISPNMISNLIGSGQQLVETISGVSTEEKQATVAINENTLSVQRNGLQLQSAEARAKALAAAVKRMKDEFAAASGKFRSAVSTQSDLIESIQSMRSELDGLNPKLGRNGRAFSLMTQGGRRAAEALSNVADNAEQAALAAADAGKWNRAARLLGMARAAIEQQAMEWGMSESAARSYANSLLTIPTEIRTVIRQMYVQEQGLMSADAAERWAAGMPSDYNPYGTTRSGYRGSGSSGGSGASGGGSGGSSGSRAADRKRAIRQAMRDAAETVRQARLDLATSIAQTAFGVGSVLGFDSGAGSNARSALADAKRDVSEYASAVRAAKLDILSIGPGSDPETLKRRAEARRALAEAESDYADAVKRRGTAEAQVAKTTMSGENLLASMRQRVDRVKRFGGLLRKLDRAGLNPNTLAEIAQSGPEEGFAVAKAMVDSPELMTAFNRQQRRLAKYSAAAGTFVGNQAYIWDVAKTNAKNAEKAAKGDMQPIVVELKLDTATVVRQIVGYKRRTGGRDLGIS